MTNEFLRGLNLDEEIIQKIQAENGKDINAAKTKMQTQIDALNSNVSDLQGQLSERDASIATIQEQLKDAQGSKTKFNELQETLNTMRTQYENDKTSWQAKLDKQQYEFLAKETLNGVKFSSNAAKENFYRKLIEKNLPVENEKLLGFEDYLTAIKAEDPGAFVVEEPNNNPPPTFSNPNNNNNNQQPPAGDSAFGFNFLGVRKHN